MPELVENGGLAHDHLVLSAHLAEREFSLGGYSLGVLHQMKYCEGVVAQVYSAPGEDNLVVVAVGGGILAPVEDVLEEESYAEASHAGVAHDRFGYANFPLHEMADSDAQ